MAREHARVFLEVIEGSGSPSRTRGRCSPTRPACWVSSRSRPGLRDRIWWGAGTRADRRVDRGAGHEPDELDAAHRGHRRAVPPAAGRADPACSGTPGRTPATSASRGSRSAAASSRSSTTTDRAYFGREAGSRDQVGYLDGGTARFGKTYAGEADQLVKDLAEDEAIAAADTLLLTIPNQLGVDYNAHLLDSISVRRAGARLALKLTAGRTSHVFNHV